MQGGGYHGHIGLITKLKLYNNLSNAAWMDPLDPGVYLPVTTTGTNFRHKQLQ